MACWKASSPMVTLDTTGAFFSSTCIGSEMVSERQSTSRTPTHRISGFMGVSFLLVSHGESDEEVLNSGARLESYP